MKPRVNTDGHGCGREILHTACAKFGRGEIVSAARSQLAIRQIFHALSGKLTAEFGRGFTKTNLFNMSAARRLSPTQKIVHALSANLNWTHLRRIVYLDDPLKRDFYAEMCRMERWNTRT